MLPSSGAFELPLIPSPSVRLCASDRIATMGSCFAQHVGRQLSDWGYRYYFTESERSDGGPPIFSCRYGNVYTVRQALQLIDRSERPDDYIGEIWMRNGRFFDAYRPLVYPEGFPSEAQLLGDRRRHLHNVASLLATMDVLIFTLGLTEAWLSRTTGTAYPSAPGVLAGDFDPTLHSFHNFGVEEVVSDLRLFISRLRQRNPLLKVILSVSPVAIAATYEQRHVLVSSTYTKSVLRVAADTITREFDGVDYLPTYEAIVAPNYRYRFLNPDCRTVTPAGVRHAMRLFATYFEGASTPPDTSGHLAAANALANSSQVLCDEEYNQPA